MVSGTQEIRVRLPGLVLSGARTEELGDGLVKEIRLERAGADAVLRVLLEGTAGEVKDSVLQDPFRLVLDIYRPREPGGDAHGRGGIQPLRLIVLDAGHGGHDPGATGPSGVMEKDVVLDVTKRVARLAEDGLGVKIALSRTTDVFVPLRDRTNFANKLRADLFVSIHANAHPRAFSEGVETYFLSSEASDSEARQVAAIENDVVQLETPAARQKGDVLKSILWDLAQSEFQAESSFMAETVQDSMTQSLHLVNRGVKQAGFYVLGGAAMPAILIEVGFLTNRKEERKLATPAYREAVARAIYAGLAEYKRRYDQRVRTVQTQPVRSEASR
jgi:N-acetylmuramoyl-L-alanine amidase